MTKEKEWQLNVCRNVPSSLFNNIKVKWWCTYSKIVHNSLYKYNTLDSYVGIYKT